MKDVEKDTSVFADIDLDLKNKISSFEMIGWTDPSNPQINKPMQWLKSLNHDEYLYPKDTYDPKNPPRCVFVPEQAIMHKMINAVAMYMDDIPVLYSKFGYLEQPKPQWMIEQEKIVLERMKEEARIRGDLEESSMCTGDSQ